MRWEIPLVALLAVLAVAGLAAAAEDSGPKVRILEDTGPNGTTRAGTVNTLGWVLVNEDGAPAFHQDAVFEVTHEGRTLLRTTAASGHDYDGIDPYKVAFPSPGNYTVRAVVHDDGEKRTATMDGTVLPAPEDRARLAIDAPRTAETGEAVKLSYEVTGPGGEPVDHADVTVRIRRASDGFEVFKTTTHDHDGEHRLRYTFARTGTFEITFVATPVGAEGSPLLSPVAATRTVEVEAGTPSPSAPEPGTDRPLVNDRVSDGSGAYRLFGTYDPYTSVGPHGRLRLGAITLDAQTRAPVDGVRYRAVLYGPSDTEILRSSSLYAVDGFLEVTTSRPDLGSYELVVHASKGDWSANVTLPFTVQAPIAATNSGPLFAVPNATGTMEAGSPVTLPIHVEDAAGVPLLHGEVDWRILAEDTGVPVFAGKLHAHENGTLPLTVRFPEAGSYRAELMPESLQPAPTPRTWGAQPGQAPFFTLDVEPGAMVDEADEALEPTSTEDPNGTPGASIGLVVGTLAVLAAVRRRS